MKPNRVKELLNRGQVPIGHMVVEFWVRGLAKQLEAIGFDFVIYDMEHSGYTIGDLADQLAWIKATPLTPIVRPPASDYHHISRALDAGVQGVMIPRVETLDEVRHVVEAVKYPPEGKRGISFSIAHDDFLGGDGLEKMRSANNETLVIIQIENVSAVEHIDKFLAVPGVDMAWVGQYDLTASMGITAQFDHPRLQEAMTRVVNACRRAGKVAGIQPTSVSQAMTWTEQGFGCISYSEDMLVYMEACGRAVGELRAHLGQEALTVP
jgi:2-dehydro-3-deoxyglucarate aldolase/4-hydroxy-2-oxoheptanedioate aldolase